MNDNLIIIEEYVKNRVENKQTKDIHSFFCLDKNSMDNHVQKIKKSIQKINNLLTDLQNLEKK